MTAFGTFRKNPYTEFPSYQGNTEIDNIIINQCYCKNIYCTNYIVYSMSYDFATVTKLQQCLTLVMSFDLATVTELQLGLIENY